MSSENIYDTSGKLNIFAFLSFVFALVSLLWWTNPIFTLLALVLFPLSIIFGHIGLHQISYKGDSGTWMSITALVLGYGAIALVIVALLGVAFIYGVDFLFQLNAAGPAGMGIKF